MQQNFIPRFKTISANIASMGSKQTASSVLGRALRETGAALRFRGNAEIFLRHRPKVTFRGDQPFQTHDTFIAPSASVIGNVTCWDQSSIWYKAVVRADSTHAITIGHSSSVGDGSVVMTLPESVRELESGFPPETDIGHHVTIGAGCVLKSCRIESYCLVGDKCTILEGALLERYSILESGTVVLPYQRIPSGQKWSGNPAKYVGELTKAELERFEPLSYSVHCKAWKQIMELLPYGYSYVQLEDLEKQAAIKKGVA